MGPCRFLALPALALLLGACGGTGEEGLPAQPDAGPVVGAEPGPAGEVQTCENDRAGFAVSFPVDWHTNEQDGLPGCSAFDPNPIVLPENGEIPFDLAVIITRRDVAFEEATTGNRFEERLAAEETAVADRRALRVETRATGEGLADAGMVSYRYYVELDGETLVAETHDVEGTDHERNRRVLDEMLQTIELYDLR